MGRDFSDAQVQRLISEGRYGYSIVADPHETEAVRIQLGGAYYSPEQLSAEILKKVVVDAVAAAGQDVDAAVVTVPAYFSDQQKFATRAACSQAGLKLLRLLPEPTAAAISFGMQELSAGQAQQVMIFDLGGGTFDVSVLSVVDGKFLEIAKGGDMWLGGDDIDQLLLNKVFAHTEAESGCGDIKALIEALPSAERARFKVELREKAERAKIELSTQDEATIEAFGTLKDANGKLIDIDFSITVDEFSELLAPMNDSLLKISMKILKSIHFEPDLIDTVLMVGGSSLIPAVQQSLRGLFGAEKVRVHPRPMFAVVEGAAIMAHKLSGKQAEAESQDILHASAHDYYLQLANGERLLLVPRNASLPAKCEHVLHFTSKDQMLARLRVLNEIDDVMESVGEVWLYINGDPLTEMPHGRVTMPSLLLKFAVDQDNVIRIAASVNETSGAMVEGTIARGGTVKLLLNELETVLSGTKFDTNVIEATSLSRIIHSNIAKIGDADTGMQSQERIKQAKAQLGCFQEILAGAVIDEVPCSKVLLARAVLKTAGVMLSSHDKSRVQSGIDSLEKPLREFTDPAAILAASSEMSDVLNDLDGPRELALLVMRNEYSSEFYDRTEIELVQNAIASYVAGDMEGYEKYMRQVGRICDEWLDYDDDTLEPAKIHRDVQIHAN